MNGCRHTARAAPPRSRSAALRRLGVSAPAGPRRNRLAATPPVLVGRSPAESWFGTTLLCFPCLAPPEARSLPMAVLSQRASARLTGISARSGPESGARRRSPSAHSFRQYLWPPPANDTVCVMACVTSRLMSHSELECRASSSSGTACCG
jgi:hypothetical protein